MKYTSQELLKIDKLLESIIENTELRRDKFGKLFCSETLPKLEAARYAVRSIANAIGENAF